MREVEWHDTLIVITSDHGEQLGDHGLIEKIGLLPQSYHVIVLARPATKERCEECPALH